MLEDSTFDGALAFGPFYHITHLPARSRALEELLRVCRRRAPIFISAISRFGVFKTVLQRIQEELTDPDHRDMFEKGIHRTHVGKLGRPTPDYYFDTPPELKAFCENHGMRTICMTALEGLSSHLREETNRLSKNKKAWKAWMRLIFKTAEEASILGASEHFLYVGTKS